MTEFYVGLLRKSVTTTDTVKVSLRFVENGGNAPSVRQLLSVALAMWPFPFVEYVERDDLGKKRMILDAVQAALLWIAELRQWDTQRLKDCYDTILVHNLTFERWSKKSWRTQNPKYRLRVGFSFELRSIDFFVGLFDRKGIEIGRKDLGSVVPEEGIVNEVLNGNGAWVRDHFFRLRIASSCFYAPRAWKVDLSDLLG